MMEIEQAFREKKPFLSRIQGDSMYPMLIQGRDIAVITPPIFPLKRYDVPVYRRNGCYVMHRIVKVRKQGYLICGDNRTRLERDITDKDIVGVLSAFYHNGILVSCTDREYLRYSRRVVRSLPWRIGKDRIKRCIRKICGKELRL